jgi:hypothetical protein
MQRFIIASLMLLTLTANQGVTDGTLSVGVPEVEEDHYTIPVLLHGNSEEIAALNFRFQYDPEVFVPLSVSSGTAAVKASKVVTANMPEPGEYIVVMMGLNQSTLTSGEIARVKLQCRNKAALASSPIRVLDPALATWNGEAVAVSGSENRADLPAGGKHGSGDNSRGSRAENREKDSEEAYGGYNAAGVLTGESEPRPAGRDPRGLENSPFIGQRVVSGSKNRQPQKDTEDLRQATREVARLRKSIATPASAETGPDAEESGDTETGGNAPDTRTEIEISAGEPGFEIARASSPDLTIESERGNVSAVNTTEETADSAGTRTGKTPSRYGILVSLALIPVAVVLLILLVLNRTFFRRGFPLKEDA